MAGPQRPTYATGQRVWLGTPTDRTSAVVLTVGPSRIRVRYQYPGTPSRAAHPVERWVQAAVLAPRAEDHPIDAGYAEAYAGGCPLDVLSDEPPHPDEGPEWPVRIVHADGSACEEAVRGHSEAEAMDNAWWNWPGALRIERPATAPRDLS
jgi:hypothetical protein